MPAATLHMDVESVQSMQHNLQSQYESILSALQTLKGTVQNTVGTAWSGQSATQFQDQFTQIDASITQQLEGLRDLADALRREIEQWQQMSSTLG